MQSIEEQIAGKVPDVNVDTMGQGGRNVEGIGYVVNSLGEDQSRNGSSKTDVPTYKE